MSAITDAIEEIIYGSAHQGSALRNMVKEYASTPAMLGELVQNSVDLELGGATKIDIHIDYDSSTICYYDNGPGLSDKTLRAAVGTFGQSIKRGDRYGQFGIGFGAPLSICADFLFVTSQRGEKGYRSYYFNRDKLFSVVSGGYPIEKRLVNNIIHGDDKKISRGSEGKEVVWWRTSIMMSGLTEDKQKRKLDVDSFKDDIQSAYGKKLFELGTKITIVVIENGARKETEFRAKLYQGKQLDEWNVERPVVGEVKVNFYLSPIGYAGTNRIDVGSTTAPSRVAFTKLYLSERFYGCLAEKTKAALNSKMFQGEILGEHIKLLTNRRGFVQDDALLALALALDEWYLAVGYRYHEDERKKRQSDRYQEIGLAAIDAMKETLLGPNSAFAELLLRAEYGSVGKGHAEIPKTSRTGVELIAKTAPLKGPSKGVSELGRGGGVQKENPSHHPGVVAGQEGGKREVVKGHSAGLHILFADTGERMWSFNGAALCITINDTHPAFAAVESNDRRLKEYYMMLVASALRVELEDDRRIQEANRLFSEHLVHDWVFSVVKSK